MQSREKHVSKHESELRFNRFLWKSVENTQFRNAHSNPVQRNKWKSRFLQNLSVVNRERLCGTSAFYFGCFRNFWFDCEHDTDGRETMTDMIHKTDKMTIKTTSRDCEHDTRGWHTYSQECLLRTAIVLTLHGQCECQRTKNHTQKKARHVLGEFVRELEWTPVDV